MGYKVLFLIVSLIAGLARAELSRDQMIELLNEGYSSAVQVTSVEKKATLFGCSNQEVRLSSKDPITGKQRVVELSVFKPVGKPAKRAILIVPPTGGENTIDRAYSYLFCKDKYDVVIVSHWSQLDEVSADLRSHDMAMRRGVTAIRNAIDYIGKPVGIFGTSLGAIFSSSALAVDRRIEAGLLVVGGAPVPEVFAKSDHHKVRKIREKVMKANGFTDVQVYQDALEKAIQIQVDKIADPRHEFALKIFVAKNDKTVQTKNQYLLWEAWGRPDLVEMNRGHIDGVFEAYARHSGTIRNFFIENLPR